MRTSLLSLAAALLVAPAAVALPLSFAGGTNQTVVGGYTQIVLAAQFGITNVGSEDLTLGLERQMLTEVSGSENNFCFGTGCYPPHVSVSPQSITLAVGATDNTFIGDYSPNGQAGITRIRYAFYDVNGLGVAADTAYVTVTYDASQRVTGLAADLATSTLLSAPAPNPAAAGANIVLTLGTDVPSGAVLRLVDLRDGRTVRTTALNAELLSWCVTVAPARTSTSGCTSATGIAPGGCYGSGDSEPATTATRPAVSTVTVSTTGLAAGVYGCLLVDGQGRARAMQRLVVR